MFKPERCTYHRIICFGFALLFAGGVFCSSSRGDNEGLRGAETLIHHIKNPSGPTPDKVEMSGAHQLKMELDQFKQIRDSLPEDRAISMWLDYYDRFWELSPEDIKTMVMRQQMAYGSDTETLSLYHLLSSIPPPSTWDSLKTSILSRQRADKEYKDYGLKLIAYYLTQDMEELERTVEELKSMLILSGRDASFLEYYLPKKNMIQNNGDGLSLEESFSRYLDSLNSERPEGKLVVQVPDLANSVSETRVRDTLRKLISIPGLRMSIPGGGKTLEMARKLVLEEADRLLEPQWKLVSSPEDLELYEAISRRFPEKPDASTDQDLFREQDYYGHYYDDRLDEDRSRARMNYIMGLISRGRIDEAVAISRELMDNRFSEGEFEKIWQSFEKIRYADELMQYCEQLLSEKPEIPMWKRCGYIAAAESKSSRLIDILDRLLSGSDKGTVIRMGINQRKVDLLLASDRAEDAIILLKKLISQETDEESIQTQWTVTRVKSDLAVTLFKLGQLLDRPDCITFSRDHFLILYTRLLTQPDQVYYQLSDDYQSSGKMVNLLIEEGFTEDAEQILLNKYDVFRSTVESTYSKEQFDQALASGQLVEFLIKFMKIYDRSEGYEDIVILLEKAPWWGAKDLKSLVNKNSDIGPLAAKALYHGGRRSTAAEILKWHLLNYPGDDTAYKLLVEIEGESLIPWLDDLYGRDRFEERPLIWKAHLLRMKGELEKAEAVARQALKVDPTDGEQKAGERVHGYDVLGDILEAQGKSEDSAFFKQVVRSVRTAEKGDEFTDAGLIQRSLALYMDAAIDFADAYCVQWRLAERLSALGKMEEAQKHYEIAFERMPEQFGQVASVCFGCEGVFTHQQSVSVADNVLTRLSQTMPDKPQVYFLLGELREAQGRRVEAYNHYRKAFELDPDYFDALEKAHSLQSELFLSRDEIDDLALKIVRLDPLQKHGSVTVDEIMNLKELWRIYENLRPYEVDYEKPIYPLPASVRAYEELAEKLGPQVEMWFQSLLQFDRKLDFPDPGDAVARNRFILGILNSALFQYMGAY